MTTILPMTRETWHEFYEKYVPDPMMTPDPYTYDYELGESKFEGKKDDPARKYFAVFYEEMLVGQVYLKRIDYEKKTAEAAIALITDAVKGRGAGTEAIKLLISYAFDEMGLETILGDAVLRNTRSQHIMQKLGFEFTHEGEKFKHYRLQKTKEILLAGGCFWGVEKYMGLLPQVVETEVGFANGNGTNPTYEEVYTGTTGFAEVVRVVYKGGLEELLTQFYKIIDPTTKNRQAGDVGSHYRTGIYFLRSVDEPIIAKTLTELQKEYDAPIVVECLPLENYYKAEEYHQKYLDKNPEGYCHIPEEMYEEARNSVSLS